MNRPYAVPVDQATRRRAIRTRMLVMLVGLVAGAVLGAALSFPIEGLRPTSTAEVTLTAGPHAKDHGVVPASQAQYTEAQALQLAALISTQQVRDQVPGLAPSDRLTGLAPEGTEVVEITVAADDASTVRAKAGRTATAVTRMVTQQQAARPGGAVLDIALTQLGGPVVDQRIPAAVQYATLGGVLGALLAMLGVELLAPGAWRRPVEATQPMSVGAGARQMSGEIERILDSWLYACRTPRGLVVPVAALFAVFGYALTGSALPPLAVALLAGYAGLRDSRYAAAGLGLFTLTVLPAKIDLIKIGPVTPTVLEVSLVLGLLCTVWRPGNRGRPRTAFTPLLLGLIGAVLLGGLVGYVGHGDFPTISEYTRALLLVLTFFVMYRAFRGRVSELLAMLLVGGAAACTVEIFAALAGLQLLQTDERTQVLTGADTSEVSRLDSPVLMLCGPLLILLFSGVVSHRNRWVMVALTVPVLAMEALSFNRSTWGPLLVAFVVIAGVCWGNRGIVRRLTGLVLIGGAVIGLASAGALGSTGDALALRVDSLISGNALQEDSLADRLRENTAAWATLRDSPLVGTGVGVSYGGTVVTYDDVMSRVQIDPRPYIHNQYLRVWLLFGALGLLAFGAVGVRVITLVYLCWRHRAPGAPTVIALGFGLALIALQSIFQTTLVTREFVAGCATMLAALAAAAQWQPGRMPVPGATALRALARRSFAGQWAGRGTGGDRITATSTTTGAP